MKNYTTNKAVEKMVADCVDKLGEHCESVRIFVTFPETGKTTNAMHKGTGNFYASYGQILEFMHAQEAITKQENTRPPEEPRAF